MTDTDNMMGPVLKELTFSEAIALWEKQMGYTKCVHCRCISLCEDGICGECRAEARDKEQVRNHLAQQKDQELLPRSPFSSKRVQDEVEPVYYSEIRQFSAEKHS